MPMTETEAVLETQAYFADNNWFLESYWPENAPRVKKMILDGGAPSQKILDIGCGVGYVSDILALMGHDVTATDAWELPLRDARFANSG